MCRWRYEDTGRGPGSLGDEEQPEGAHLMKAPASLKCRYSQLSLVAGTSPGRSRSPAFQYSDLDCVQNSRSTIFKIEIILSILTNLKHLRPEKGFMYTVCVLVGAKHAVYLQLSPILPVVFAPSDIII